MMKTDTKFCFVLFYVVFEEIYVLNLLLPRKLQVLLRTHVYSFVYFLCVGIPILKIVLSHAHKWVISDVIL